MRAALNRFVFEVNLQRRKEDKQQNERNHDVIRNAPTVVRPPDKARDGSPHAPHNREASSVVPAPTLGTARAGAENEPQMTRWPDHQPTASDELHSCSSPWWFCWWPSFSGGRPLPW